ncbi:Uncharacterised protein [Serratia grimesii]|uniref:right-handed parallel beta-helix repeat-containing protein n=1 Tax=Serratia grimesii TaxID=82995 RepID=UPI002178577B|nr:right-handed parallel beta-helix repeat-containing protein [Serratia grimesii]CAI1515324.1 Uncharacterised protein [Serratia grimesii]
MNRRKFVESLALLPAFYLIPHQLLAKTVSYVARPGTNQININELGARSSPEAGTSSFDNRDIIQKAIDMCESKFHQSGVRWSIYIPQGIFYVSATNYIEESTKSQVGICSLILKSNIIITGPGTIKLMDHQYGKGAFFRMLGSYRGNKNNLSNVDIEQITLDGNASNQTAGIQASNMLLECSENITIKDVKSLNANGNGIQLRGSNSHAGAVKNVNITTCRVDSCKKIGIQVAQFDSLVIEDNYVTNCGDNGIDIYGDMGNGSYPNVNGNNFIIRNNKIANCSNGIFPETVANGRIYNNEIRDSRESGLHLNRIHGLPQNISVEKNTVIGGDFGISLTGDMQNINIKNNEFQKIRDSFISLGSGNGNSSNVNATGNIFHLDSTTQSIVKMNGASIRKINIEENKIITKEDEKSVQKIITSNNAKKIDGSVKIQNFIISQ